MGQPLPPDTGGSTSEDLDAMRRDARAWRDSAARMGHAAAAAQGLQLGEYDFSFLGIDSGLVDAYRETHRWALGLLQGAQENLGRMGSALEETANTYAAHDEAAADSFGKLNDGPGGN
jgi:hypothetical protein